MGKRKMKILIKTFGCKVNQYNSQLLRENLILNGAIMADSYKEADIIIINSCVVTETAEREISKEVRRANTASKGVFLTGCLSSSLKEFLHQSNILFFTDNKELISEVLAKNKEDINLNNTISSFSGRTRAFIKIQSGCNRFCSYCIVPYVRGALESRKKGEILSEIEKVLNRGYKEIVLTGTQIGLYNYCGEKLSDLIEEIIKTFPSLNRIRISSIDPTLIDEKLIELMSNPATPLCNHLHIPLQSGSDRILKLMNRKYTSDYYSELTKILKKNIKDLNITTDVIIGFPSEKEEDFIKTTKLIEVVKFSKVHIFPYSDRVETLSFNMKPKVDSAVKKKRVKKLLELSNKVGYNVKSSFIGRKVLVLVENGKMGFSRNYLRVKLDESSPVASGEIVSIDIKSCDYKFLYGQKQN
jgi:threonylcarbamoyladenosine tRNA methylthiotransferase MtaB